MEYKSVFAKMAGDGFLYMWNALKKHAWIVKFVEPLMGYRFVLEGMIRPL